MHRLNNVRLAAKLLAVLGLKRALKGTNIHMSGVRLDRYVDEQAFRFNEHHRNDSERFRMVVSSAQGKRLTYRELTG